MMKPIRLLASSLLIVCLIACLCACTQEPAAQTQPQTTAQEKTVRFFIADTLYTQQTVVVGACPEEVTPDVSGLVISGWVDSAGNPADPAGISVTEDTDYQAVFYPALSNHTPYLFMEEDGLCRPNDPLTADELVLAMNALASEDAKGYFPKILTGNVPASRDYVRKTLGGFFAGETVDQALPASNVSQLSRWEFAVAMNLLLGRSESEAVVFSGDLQLPADLFCEQAGSYDLLEAILPHEVSSEGTALSMIELPTAHEPGLVNIDGWLYYVEEDGQFLRDGNVGELYFGQNGRYSCGDAALDEQVAQVLAKLISENPEMDRLELLRQCQIYCRDTFEYLRRDPYLMGDTGWEIKDAKDMFEKGRGNCYGFAAAFWALARGLGYEAYAVSGTCLEDEQPHSWVVIEFDGEEFFFDPEWEWAYHDREVYDKDMFMLSLSEATWWGYKWYRHW